jgi:hypothetical protein
VTPRRNSQARRGKWRNELASLPPPAGLGCLPSEQRDDFRRRSIIPAVGMGIRMIPVWPSVWMISIWSRNHTSGAINAGRAIDGRVGFAREQRQNCYDEERSFHFGHSFFWATRASPLSKALGYSMRARSLESRKILMALGDHVPFIQMRKFERIEKHRVDSATMKSGANDQRRRSLRVGFFAQATDAMW